MHTFRPDSKEDRHPCYFCITLALSPVLRLPRSAGRINLFPCDSAFHLEVTYFVVHTVRPSVRLFYIYRLTVTSPPVGVRSIVISVSVCLFVCPLVYLKIHTPKFHFFGDWVSYRRYIEIGLLNRLCYGSYAAQLVTKHASKFPPNGHRRLAQK